MPGESDILHALRERLIGVCREAYALGLTLGTSGNISVRAGSGKILIKATGTSMGNMTEKDTVLVDMDGNIAEETTARPSTEVLFHAAIYGVREDVGAVVHLHPPYTTAFAHLQKMPPLLTATSRAYLKDKIALIPKAPAGSAELASLVESAFRSPNVMAALLADHGNVAVGRDLYSAFYLAQYLEDACRMAVIVQQLQK
ncbi:MAG: class II aldolase/adducin family protein [Synergistales bacterium]|jgi:L-ribulose-5-phosphate 4-epimerase|nr:class II aldolase/adducin family protein [Synergistales bacterium]HHV53569.1 class II aldolase/adducin family protein [Synergistaceae bacterium]